MFALVGERTPPNFGDVFLLFLFMRSSIIFFLLVFLLVEERSRPFTAKGRGTGSAVEPEPRLGRGYGTTWLVCRAGAN